MSKFSRFMKANKIAKSNEKYAPTKSLCDEKGNPLEWEFKRITSRENDDLRDECTIEVQITGKPGMYRSRLLTNLYMRRLITASTVYPDLYDAELQDSYGVKSPEELLQAIVDDPGEYANLSSFVQKFQGFDTIFAEKVEQAKN